MLQRGARAIVLGLLVAGTLGAGPTGSLMADSPSRAAMLKSARTWMYQIQELEQDGAIAALAATHRHFNPVSLDVTLPWQVAETSVDIAISLEPTRSGRRADAGRDVLRDRRRRSRSAGRSQSRGAGGTDGEEPRAAPRRVCLTSPPGAHANTEMRRSPSIETKSLRCRHAHAAPTRSPMGSQRDVDNVATPTPDLTGCRTRCAHCRRTEHRCAPRVSEQHVGPPDLLDVAPRPSTDYTVPISDPTRMAAGPRIGHSCSQMPQPTHRSGST